LNRFVDIDHLEFMVTYRCNSQCRHCYIRQSQKVGHPTAIDVHLASRIVEELVQEYSLQSIMILGGEPLLYPDIVCAILETARRKGIPCREIITNAGRPDSEGEFRSVAFHLAESGVSRILISVDSFHQQFIPLDIVKRNVKALIDAGIAELEWNPCWLIDRDHDNLWNRSTKEVLQLLKPLGIQESAGNVVQPLGNALTNLAEFMPARTSCPQGVCEDVPYAQRLDKIGSISIEPDGSIAICQAFVIGNAGAQDINQILRSYNPHQMPEIAAILNGGIRQLIDLARTRGIEIDRDGYYSSCDLCMSLTRRMAEPDRQGAKR
jgi:MoaA/NifB/PqqE/SkfB family radical SAM enzyme